MTNVPDSDAFLSGETVYLRLPDINQDVMRGEWHTWFNDPAITRYLVHGVFPVSREQQAEFVRQSLENRATLLLTIVEKATHRHGGVISLKDIDLLNRRAEIGIVMGRRSAPGAALEAMSLVLQHAFERMNLSKVYAGQHEALWKWINQLELIGFELEGYRSQFGCRNGTSYGVVYTAASAERYFELKRARGGNLLGNSMEELLRLRRRENVVEMMRACIMEFQRSLRNDSNPQNERG